MPICYYNSSNQAKHEEVAHVFRDSPNPPRKLHHDITEILSANLKEVVLAKAAAAYQRARVPLFVEHGGLFIEHLKGLPGPLVKPIWQALKGGLCGLIPEQAPRDAEFIQMVCYCDGKKRTVFHGRVRGTIALRAAGENGIHWHPVFIPKGAEQTFGQMSVDERVLAGAAQAFEALRAELRL
jgi:XTP/dITP diphosphohydrolase